MDNQNFGKEFFTRTFDPDFINGFGKRPYNWEMGVSVQQEVAPRVGVTVGYYRRWFGNFYTLDNTPDHGVRLHAVQRADPGRSAAAGRRRRRGERHLQPQSQQGRTGPGPRPARRATSAPSRPKTGTAWTSASTRGCGTGSPCRQARARDARFRTTARFGRCCRRPIPGRPSPSTQSLRGDSTAGLTSPYCRIVEPFLTSFRGLATYVVPKVDVQVSGTWRSDPGTELAANYVVTSAIANSGPQPLGRNLSSGQHHRQPDPERHAVLRSPQQHRFPGREDPPLRPDAHAGRDRRLQRHEQRHRHGRQRDVRSPTSDGSMADADGHRDRAIREVQLPDRFLGPVGTRVPQSRWVKRGAESDVVQAFRPARGPT